MSIWIIYVIGIPCIKWRPGTYARNVMSYRKSLTEDVTVHEGRLYLDLLHPGLYLNAELNSICHLLALLEARHILHVSS